MEYGDLIHLFFNFLEILVVISAILLIGFIFKLKKIFKKINIIEEKIEKIEKKYKEEEHLRGCGGKGSDFKNSNLINYT